MTITYKEYKITKDGINYVLTKGEKDTFCGYFTSMLSAILKIYILEMYTKGKRNEKKDKELAALYRAHKTSYKRIYNLSSSIYDSIDDVKKQIYGF